ncbi:hypothetical protein NS365_03985 [Aureimonas ureilytica]|uniref:Gamma-butyrobetaine hydroxylase-like N-terminal domain-containing protein n=1 Tax=Aureimonas ureilytica TaxID=401562 RepID=A0A175R9Z9_9HYPH|nr:MULTISPECIES: DUF971 domain-containing protein [Aureimonas]KTQ96773.1 hypothetical protein NS226_06540 [Aureimonas ureilytica]KTR07458.1 hypothetical protein NS365_03985 [Aureimonas ureilytica]
MCAAPVPEEIRVLPDRKTLVLRFGSAPPAEITAEMLRVLSPSAEVQGHSPDQRVTVGGKREVRIANIFPVGHYAIRIAFDDRHDTGIYTWTYLLQLARDGGRLWNAYLDELAAKGLSRDS